MIKRLSESISIERYPLKEEEKELLSKFIDFLEIVNEHTDKYDLENYSAFKKKSKPYREYLFFKPFEKAIEKIEEGIKKSSDDPSKDVRKMIALKNLMIKDLRNKKSVSISNKMNHLRENIQKSLKEPEYYLRIYFKNYLKKENSLFKNQELSLSGVFSKFLINDLITQRDRYLNGLVIGRMPTKNLDLLLRFIANIDISNRDDKKDIKSFLLFHYSGDDKFLGFLDLIRDYTKKNDRKLLETIIKKMPEFDMFYKLHEQSKKNITQVYRGIGLYDEHDEKITKDYILDNEQKYVSTSLDKEAALNFAYMRGHLETKRRSDYGFLITYFPKPKDIVFNTNIIWSIFDEKEVIIDTSNIKKKIKEV